MSERVMAAVTPVGVQVLRALARRARVGEEFSALDVMAAMRDAPLRRCTVERALDTLAARALLERAGAVYPSWGEELVLWRLTGRGQRLARQVRASLRAAAPRAPRPVGRQRRAARRRSLAQRLWDLLLVRRRLTAAEAVDVLLEAGEDAAAKRRTLLGYLRRWAQRSPRLLAERGAGVERHYVLLSDAQVVPPPCR